MHFDQLVAMKLDDLYNLMNCLGYHEKYNLLINIRKLLYLRRCWYRVLYGDSEEYQLTLEEEYALRSYEIIVSEEPEGKLETFIVSNFTLLQRQEFEMKSVNSTFYQ